ncbi:MAG: hypothetical protein QOJ21_528 [Solirubrobacteraceae bacterium]|nr:hypothetical protein [Solirubrobacteraceae bacterium]
MDLARVLVIANRTADSPQLRAALLQRRERGPIAVTLLVPAGWEIQEPGGDVASGRRRLDAAVRGLEEHGLPVEARLGDPDPVAALRDAWRPGRFDELIVSTLPGGRSRWMALDLPRHARSITGVAVTHVEAAPAAAGG